MFSYELSNRKKLQIYALGDTHIGSAHFNEDFLKYWDKVFTGTKSDKLIYLMGDLIDVATKRLGNSAFQQEMNVNEQIEYVIKFLEKHKQYIAGSVNSNHLDRTLKEFDLDIGRIIANNLECEHAPSLYHELFINDNPYRVFAMHGTKTSNQLHLMFGALQRQTNHIEADLVLAGHCHYCSSISIPSINPRGYKRTHYVLTGHFLDYEGSYAHHQALKPNPPCFPIINIGVNDNNKINTFVKIVNADEVI